MTAGSDSIGQTAPVAARSVPERADDGAKLIRDPGQLVNRLPGLRDRGLIVGCLADNGTEFTVRFPLASPPARDDGR